MKRRLLLSAVWLASALVARAFVLDQDAQGRSLHWDLSAPPGSTSTNVVNPVTRAVRFFIGANAYSATNRAAELNVVRDCFAQWQAVPGTALKFEEGGLMGAGVDVNTADNTNVVFWARTTLVNGGHDDISGALGYTYYDYFDDNTLAEVDIVLNGAQFIWSTDPQPPPNVYYIGGVLLHEIGHMIGLEHSPLGGATMFARGEGGSSGQAGLSPDDIAGARALYGLPVFAATLGTVRGVVSLNGAGILGALVTAEDSHGNASQATVTSANGTYQMLAVPPGSYQVRVTPLDPFGPNRLVAGWDIATNYISAQTTFLPSGATTVSVTAGATQTRNFAVTNGPPAFRIARIHMPSTDPGQYTAVNAPASLAAGQSNIYLGVYSADLPASGANLMITGDGITLGSPIYVPSVFPGFNLLYAPANIASTATPGIRSFVLTQGSGIAYANGFLEILPPLPVVRFQNITATADACILQWSSVPGKHYQVDARATLGASSWQPVSPVLTAMTNVTSWTDSPLTNPARYYRIEMISP